MSALTPERLAEIRERAVLQWHLEGPDAYALVKHVDHLTAENARLREGIEDATQALWEAWVEGGDTDLIDQASADLKALLNPTEGETDHE